MSTLTRVGEIVNIGRRLVLLLYYRTFILLPLVVCVTLCLALYRVSYTRVAVVCRQVGTVMCDLPTGRVRNRNLRPFVERKQN